VNSRIATAAAALLFVSCFTPAAIGQEGSSRGGGPAAREFGFYAGVSPSPGEIGRDVNRAGGDTLVASLGTSPVIGGRFEIHNGLVGGGISVLVWLRSVGVQNEAGVHFPNHGEPPLLYMGEARLYPFRKSLAGGRVSPYLAAGFGGALVSVDLDNINDQELRHLWARGLGGGVKFHVGDGETFVDIQVMACSLLGRGPLEPFTVRSLVIGLGLRE